MKILAFGAHPDDIEPQIGGTLAKFANNGAEVTNVIVTQTGTGADNHKRESEGRSAASILGLNYISMNIDQADFSYSRIYIQEIDKLISIEKPNIVFTTHPNDSHNDHNNVARSIMSCGRKNNFSIIFNNQALPGGINASNLNYFSDISNFSKLKIDSIMCYESQIKKYGDDWLEAILGRDKLWGFTLNCNFAEAAYVKKWIT